jgi:predicted ribosome quality control (RQC) complex YloA/Tae2 family protein
MEIKIDTKKSLEQNASDYFDKGKKAKKKIDGINKIIGVYKEKLVKLEKEEIQIQEKQKKEKRVPSWYEKFRWFKTSEGFLVVGGRDAGSNEIIVKKHMEQNDIVFHTVAAGSPFFILKTEGKKPTERSLQEVADVTYLFSKSFKGGVGGINSFWVKPEQVSLTPKAGEYLEKGSFIINGKTNIIPPRFNLAIGICEDGSIMCAPLNAVKKNCVKYVELQQSRGEKTSDLAKKIERKIGGDVDEIVRVLPAGNIGIK